MDMATVSVVLIMSMVIVVLVAFFQHQLNLNKRQREEMEIIDQLGEQIMVLQNEAYLKKRVGSMDTQLEVTTGKEHMLQTLYKMDGSLDRSYD